MYTVNKYGNIYLQKTKTKHYNELPLWFCLNSLAQRDPVLAVKMCGNDADADVCGARECDSGCQWPSCWEKKSVQQFSELKQLPLVETPQAKVLFHHKHIRGNTGNKNLV